MHKIKTLKGKLFFLIYDLKKFSKINEEEYFKLKCSIIQILKNHNF